MANKYPTNLRGAIQAGIFLILARTSQRLRRWFATGSAAVGDGDWDAVPRGASPSWVEHDMVWWVPSAPPARVADRLAEVAPTLGVGQRHQLVTALTCSDASRDLPVSLAATTQIAVV